MTYGRELIFYFGAGENIYKTYYGDEIWNRIKAMLITFADRNACEKLKELHDIEIQKEVKKKDRKYKMLDSGAFSLANSGKSINIDDYIAYLHANKDIYTAYINYDDIFDPKKSWENLKYLEQNGLNPIPVYHYGEDVSWLKKMMDNHDYIGLGGVVFQSKKNIVEFWDKIFTLMGDKEGWPRWKTHGFGVTSEFLMERYPLHSVDSTSWIKYGAYTAILTPRGTIKVSEKQDDNISENTLRARFTYQTPEMQKWYSNYFKSIGMSYDILRADGPEGSKARGKANILYFLNWHDKHKPKPFKTRKISLFDFTE